MFNILLNPFPLFPAADCRKTPHHPSWYIVQLTRYNFEFLMRFHRFGYEITLLFDRNICIPDQAGVFYI